jgi:hypothetical protein
MYVCKRVVVDRRFKFDLLWINDDCRVRELVFIDDMK